MFDNIGASSGSMDMYAGESPFGCLYCAGMGYEDYPTCKKPCRIPEHRLRADSNLRDVIGFMEIQRRPYSPDMGECPYCLAAGEPVGVDCQHWTGMGWSRAGKNHFTK